MFICAIYQILIYKSFLLECRSRIINPFPLRAVDSPQLIIRSYKHAYVSGVKVQNVSILAPLDVVELLCVRHGVRHHSSYLLVIDFYSPTAQPRQLTAVLYHNTVVKLPVTPPTIDCWAKHCIQHIQ